MKLKILVAGRYNNAQHRANNYDESDILETAPEYGSLLVDEGFAEEIQEDEPEPGEDVKEKKTPAARRSRSRANNPFKPES